MDIANVVEKAINNRSNDLIREAKKIINILSKIPNITDALAVLEYVKITVIQVMIGSCEE